MKAILIDPAERSIQQIDIPGGITPEALMKLHEIVGDDLDFAYVVPGEAIAVGDHSALQNPPLPRWHFAGYFEPLYGRGVVIGHNRDGSERETRLTVEELSELITFQDPLLGPEHIPGDW